MNTLALPPDFAARVARNEPLSKHTSWRVGGPADLFFRPRDLADLTTFLQSLEAWLHRPDPHGEIDVTHLLSPYRDLPPDEIETLG